MNIVPLGFLDTWSFSATLFARYKDRFSTDHHSMGLLPLRSEEEALPILAEWKSAKALLSRVRVAAAPFLGGRAAVLGAAAVARLKPGGFVEWQMDEGPYAERHHGLHLCIVPSPGAWLYSGGESAVLPVGQLTYVNRRALYSAVNMGQTPAVHLIVDVGSPISDDPLGEALTA